MDSAKILFFKNIQKMIFVMLVLCLAIFFAIAFEGIKAKTRDMRRISDANAITSALDRYYHENGRYPNGADENQGWDESLPIQGKEGEILSELRERKYIDGGLSDPINANNYYYRYRRFPAGSYGCDKPFYILQIMNFEQKNKNHGAIGGCSSIDWLKVAPNGYTYQRLE